MIAVALVSVTVAAAWLWARATGRIITRAELDDLRRQP